MNTKLGLHIAAGPRNGYDLTCPYSRGFISFLADAFTKSHPDSFRVFRPGAEHGIYTYNGQHNWDIMPGFNQLSVEDMAAQAVYWWPKIEAAVRAEEQRLGVRIDAIQPRNESDSDERIVNEKLIAYERALMPLAEVDGRTLVIGSLSTNSPHWGQGLWQELYAPFIQEAWERGTFTEGIAISTTPLQMITSTGHFGKLITCAHWDQLALSLFPKLVLSRFPASMIS